MRIKTLSLKSHAGWLLPTICLLTAINCAPRKDQKLVIATSFYPMYIMALNVADQVPGVKVENLTPAAIGCLHDYALTVDQMKKLSGAEIFVANGAGMESFLSQVAAQYPALKVVELSGGIPLLKGSGNQGSNPHVWVSVTNAIAEVNNLGQALARFDPMHAPLYERNTAVYVEKLDSLRTKMKRELAPYKGRSIITFHEAFPYFAREFDFNIIAVIEREPGSAPNAREMAATIDLIKQSHIKVLFGEPQYPAVAAQAIAQETNAKVYTLDPAVTGCGWW